MTVRTGLSIVLIGLGAAIVPVAAIAMWANTHLLNTGAFVELYAPLAESGEVQTTLASNVGTSIREGISQGASEIASGVGSLAEDLGLPSGLVEQIASAPDAVAGGAEEIGQAAALEALQDPAFSAVWIDVLTEGHSQVMEAVQDPGANSLPIRLQTGPLIDQLRQTLTEEGHPWAALIPSVDSSFDAFEMTNLDTARKWYQLAQRGSTWLPWVAAVLLALGVAVARRPSSALFGAGVVTALASFVASTVVARAMPQILANRELSAIFWAPISNSLSSRLLMVALWACVAAVVGLVARLIWR